MCPVTLLIAPKPAMSLCAADRGFDHTLQFAAHLLVAILHEGCGFDSTYRLRATLANRDVRLFDRESKRESVNIHHAEDPQPFNDVT